MYVVLKYVRIYVLFRIASIFIPLYGRLTVLVRTTSEIVLEKKKNTASTSTSSSTIIVKER